MKKKRIWQHHQQQLLQLQRMKEKWSYIVVWKNRKRLLMGCRMSRVDEMWRRVMLDSACEFGFGMCVSNNYITCVTHCTCSIHYKEYLVNKINKAKLDPVTIYTNEKVGLMLTREELDIPEREDVEEDDQYRERLIQVSSLKNHVNPF